MDSNLKIYYTYAYLRVDRSPYYVGKGKGKRRFDRANRLVKPPKNLDRILILKSGLTEEMAFAHEIYMISVFGRKDLGTGILRNRTNGGDGSSGRVLSKESLEKMSTSSKGRPVTLETRKKLSEALKGKNKGRKASLEARQKMSKVRTGKKASSHTRQKMSESHRGDRNAFYGKRHTSESRSKMSESSKGERNPNFGKPKSPEVKAKIAASNQGKRRSPELCKKLSEAGMSRKHSPEACEKISAALSKRVGEKNPNFNKSWWYNTTTGLSKLFEECPGPGWDKGRGNTLKTKTKRK